MRTLSIDEKKGISGGASKYVYCPKCGYRKRNTLWERLVYSDRTLEGQLFSKHGLGRFKYHDSGEEAHR